MASHSARIETKAVHAGEPDGRPGAPAVMPIYQSATFYSSDDPSYDDVLYARLSNTPTHDVLHAKLASLENADAALVTASGMAAISAALLAYLGQGDHLLVQDCLYGGTHQLVYRDLRALGIKVDAFDPTAPDSWEALLRPTTRVIYAETITNPLIQVGELDSIAGFAAENELISMIDNTFASPVNFRPPEHGFNLSLHSCTKYMNGHTDVIAGAVIGDAAKVEQVRHRQNHLGGSLDAHACFLLHRGIKTLPLRVERQNDNALQLAEFLRDHPRVTTVNYAGLESSPYHVTAERLLDGFGGMLSFEVEGGVDAAHMVQDRLRIPMVAPSLGGVETLITIPARTSHAGLEPDERARVGVSESLLRISVGIEAIQDLIADFDQALA